MKMNKISYIDFIKTDEYQNFYNSVNRLFVLLEEDNSLSIYEYRCELHRSLSEVYGAKDRTVLLNQKLLDLLRTYFKIYKPTEYLFNGQVKDCYFPSDVVCVPLCSPE